MPCRLPRLAVRIFACLWLIVFSAAGIAYSNEPAIFQLKAWDGGVAGTLTIDAPRIISVRDVTPSTFVERKRSRIIQVVLSPAVTVSSTIADVNVTEVQFRIETEHQVLDFLPNTVLQSQFDGPIAITEKTIDAKGGFVYLVLPTGVKGDAAGSVKTTEVTYSQLPPKKVVSSSAHANGGKGATFTLKLTPQDTLEGRKILMLLLQTPIEFSADCVTVSVSATTRIQIRGGDPSSGSGPRKVIHATDFDVGIYLPREDDNEGKVAVERFLRESSVPVTRDDVLPFEQALQKAKITLSSEWNKIGGIRRLFGGNPARRYVEEVNKAEGNLNSARWVNRRAAQEKLRKFNGNKEVATP